MLDQLKADQSPQYGSYQLETLRQHTNAYSLFNDVSLQIKAETDINIVREIALYYLDNICSEMPDTMARKISKNISGGI